MTSTKGRLLVAEASLDEPTFSRTVVFMIEHNDDGALGLVLNRPTEVEVRDVVPAWGPFVDDAPFLFSGGPVSEDAALCLARRPQGAAPGFDPIFGDVGLLDLHLDPSDAPGGVTDIRVFAGYSGWSAGQLDGEIRRDGWYIVDAAVDDIFCTDPDSLWHRVLARQRGPLRRFAFYPDDLLVN